MLTFTRTFLAALALAAIGWQLRLHIAAGFSVLNFFSYFTNLSNLFAACVLLSSVMSRSANVGAWRDAARYVSAVNMVVVGLVFAVLLRNVDLGALRPWVNFIVHYLMPVVVVLDWLWRPPAAKLDAQLIVLALVFPIAYLVYVLSRGASMGWYPYPFLNPANVGGYEGVAMYGLGIAATFLLAGWALWAGGNRLTRAR
jgi:hypothetical protein